MKFLQPFVLSLSKDALWFDKLTTNGLAVKLERAEV
jgi:hypothetical protein